VPRAACDRVPAAARHDGVVAGPAEDQVVAGAAVEGVGTLAAMDAVVAGASADVVGAAASLEDVVPLAAGKHIGAVGPHAVERAGGPAEDDVARARIGPVRRGLSGRYDGVGDPVAVDAARGAGGGAAVLSGRRARDLGAGG